VANQIRERFRSEGKALGKDDIAILDAADYHYYQVRMQWSSFECPSLTVSYLHLVIAGMDVSWLWAVEENRNATTSAVCTTQRR
jgi:hypothetical protein